MRASATAAIGAGVEAWISKNFRRTCAQQNASATGPPSLKRRNAGFANSGLPRPHAQRTEPALNTLGVTVTVYSTPCQRPSDGRWDAGNAIRPPPRKGVE